MASNPDIKANIEQIEKAVYGKDVRAAIARGLEICYDYTSGEAADEAAARANEAAARVEAITEESQEALDEINRAISNFGNVVKVSPTEPTEPQNKIWIQPNGDTEYKVATFAAYETLWRRMNEVESTYEQGHGGIISVSMDTSYLDNDEPLKRRYVVSYSDGTTGEFFVNDGPTGERGPVDTVTAVKPFFCKQTPSEFTGVPPIEFQDNMPDNLQSGDYLWTISRITYASDTSIYIYSLGRMGQNGQDGSGAVHSIAIGANGTPMVGNVQLPVDTSPTTNSGNLLTSGAIYTALQTLATNVKNSPVFTGTPTAPTPATSENSTRLATTAFVHSLIQESGGSSGGGGGNAVMTCREVTMNSTSLEVVIENVTSNTYCLFSGIQPGDFTSELAWETTDNGMLILTTAVAPATPVTFTVILLETSAGS